MADKTSVMEQLYASVGEGERAAFYVIRDIDTGDSVDVSANFIKVKDVRAIAAGNPATTGITPTIAGTVLTLTQAGWANEEVFLMVLGNGS